MNLAGWSHAPQRKYHRAHCLRGVVRGALAGVPCIRGGGGGTEAGANEAGNEVAILALRRAFLGFFISGSFWGRGELIVDFSRGCNYCGIPDILAVTGDVRGCCGMGPARRPTKGTELLVSARAGRWPRSTLVHLSTFNPVVFSLFNTPPAYPPRWYWRTSEALEICSHHVSPTRQLRPSPPSPPRQPETFPPHP